MKSRFNLRLLILVVLALLSISNVALVHADEGNAEAVVDATGDEQVDEPESVDTPTDDVDDSAAEAATEEEEPVVVEETAAVVDEVEEDSSISFVTSAKSKATALVDKAKDITPAQMKKAAAGALGIWGVAAGAGWVMNQMGSED